MEAKPNLVQGQNRTSLLRSLKRAASTTEPRIHVVSSKGKWGIKLEGRHRLFKVYVRKDAAIRKAKLMASDGKMHLIIHDRDGMVDKHIPYQLKP